TGQLAVLAHSIDSLYNDSAFEGVRQSIRTQLRQAQSSAPFGDGLGLAASTLQDGDTILPAIQCLDTPFQCIPERVGLAATTWATFSEQSFNPFSFGSLALSTASVTFADQLIGQPSDAASVTVTNVGTAPIVLSAISVAGPHNGDFAVQHGCLVSPLSPGASCVLE